MSPGALAGAAAGAQIGRFLVVDTLGSGGMGVVLAAHDPELDRRVAIKLLHRTDQGTRLQREAQAMAKLSHPNVVAVYEVGRFDGQTFIAMELVEGTTLRGWLGEPRSWRAVTAMFVAAGRGLAAAHRAGMVHRDFKPENVLVDADQRPRVTDFGLVAGEHGRFAPPADASLDHSLTVEGAAVGTPAYMSPEHWAGVGVDARSDQFSFCVALWEALYGTRAFDGKDAGELRAAVAEGKIRPPPADRSIPRPLEAAIRRGLSRDPASRWTSMSALLDALEQVVAARRRWPWIALPMALAAAVAVWSARGDDIAIARSVRDAPQPTAGLVIEPGSMHRLTFGTACEEMPAFSPDGTTVYYDAPVGGDYHLFAMGVDGGNVRELTTTKGWDIAPVPSPDGARLAFLRTGKDPMTLYVADLDHVDQARAIAAGGLRPVWSPDGTHVWTGHRTGIWRYDVVRGTVDRTLALPPDHVPLLGLELADGRFVAALHPLDRSALVDEVVVYPATEGPPVRLVRGNLAEVLIIHPDSVSIIVAEMTENRAVELWRVPLDGGAKTLLSNGTIAARSRLAIAGRRLLWSDCSERMNLAVLGSGGDGSPLFTDLSRNDWADWYPVGVRGTSHLMFLTDRAARFEIYRMDLANRADLMRIDLGELEPAAFDVSPDGSFLAAGEGAKGLYVVPLDGAPPRLLFAESGDLSPSIDRHGRTIFFERHEGDGYRIAAISVDGGEPTWVAPSGSHDPAASPTDDVLAYLAPSGTGESIPMLLELTTGKSRALEPGAAQHPWAGMRWSPDGKRLLLFDPDTGVTELEVATGKRLREASIGADQIGGATYVGTQIVIGHQAWAGDVWTATLAAHDLRYPAARP
jgi:Tol biopolymer transport system component